MFDWLSGFYPEEIAVNNTERLRASVGAFLGIQLTSLLTFVLEGNASTFPFLIAPMVATAIIHNNGLVLEVDCLFCQLISLGSFDPQSGL
jgi:CBS-domain-containing membrane protein